MLDFSRMTEEEIAVALQRTPLLTIEQMRLDLDEQPEAHGFYAWWLLNAEALPAVPTTPHPSDPVGLLYVGIGPISGSSRRKLRQRFTDHTKRNTGSSTFRLVLAAFLFESRGWQPLWTDRPMLSREDNAALSAWQAEHLRVQWAKEAEPWRVEADVIAALRPPLNREHNQSHPFYAEVGRARDLYRVAARANPA